MTEQYIDIAKVWTVNALALISNQMLEKFGNWNDAIQAGLTTILLLASLVYTIYKILHVKNEIEEREE